jgi:hypothetical protein
MAARQKTKVFARLQEPKSTKRWACDEVRRAPQDGESVQRSRGEVSGKDEGKICAAGRGDLRKCVKIDGKSSAVSPRVTSLAVLLDSIKVTDVAADLRQICQPRSQP